MNCPNCGSYMHEGTTYCSHCGVQTIPTQVPVEYKPITPWGYVGYYILYQIPLIGFIIMLINAFGSNTNVHLKNLSRCYLILYIIAVVIYVIYFVLIIVGISASPEFAYSACISV